jgi:hypothetical protein
VVRRFRRKAVLRRTRRQARDGDRATAATMLRPSTADEAIFVRTVGTHSSDFNNAAAVGRM